MIIGQVKFADKMLAQLRFYFLPKCIYLDMPNTSPNRSSVKSLSPIASGIKPRQGLLLPLKPSFHFHHAVVTHRHDIRQPRRRQSAHAQALKTPFGLNDFIQNLGNIHPLLLRQRQRDIIYSFRMNLNFW